MLSPPAEDHCWGRSLRLAYVPAGAKEGWEMVARDSGRERVEFQTPPEPRARAWGWNSEWQR